VPRIAAGIAGVAATASGAAVAQFLAWALNPAASPVVAVGGWIIDRVPTALKEWAVATFGTADKTVLLLGVVVGLLALGGLAGVLAVRRPAAGTALVVAIGVLGTAAALTRPAAGPLDVVPGAAGTVVAVLLLRRQSGWLAAPVPGGREIAGVDRRVLLTGAVGVAAAALAASLPGRQPGSASGLVQVPVPAGSEAPLPAGLQVPGISSLRTPVLEFYRIDTALSPPQLSVADWKLTVDGLVEAPFELTWTELTALPMIERDITLTCVSNEIGGPYCGSTRWLGVPVAELLRRARPDPAADMVLSTSTDGFTASTPLAVLLDGRDAMIAIAMDGEPLPTAHGFPARLLTPGLYGYVGATKWLTRLQVTTFAADQAYWTVRGWAERAPVKTACRIDTPRDRVAPGTTAIGGVAWATHRGISRVEVQVDGGAWQAARLGPDVGLDYWRQWYLPWDATPGTHTLAARAADGSGALQPAEVRGVLPDGPTGYHVVEVTVA
jgi:DMSO/TMAO reductase YedYZ molybdopterin-dependent catalytic subunit